MTIIDTPDGIDFFAVAQCRYALDIQVHTGLKHSQGSVWKAAKKRYGLTGNIKTVRNKLAIMMEIMQQEKASGNPVASSEVGPYVEADWKRLQEFVPLLVKD